MLLVLDRSGSMHESIAADCCCAGVCAQECVTMVDCTERWSALTSAVSTTVHDATWINWGLKFFSTPAEPGQPQTDNCAVSEGAELPIGASPSAIQTQIAGVLLGSNTPTAHAITAATAYLQTVPDQSKKVILLATDGQPNCASTGGIDADVPGTLAAIRAAFDAHFKVYVIGIGPSAGDLGRLAQAGGTDHHYPATSATDLTNALVAISKAVSSCTFILKDPPRGSDANNLAVYADGELVAMDSANGWSLGATPQTVQLNGSTCDRVTSGSVNQVRVLFGCATPPQKIWMSVGGK